MIGHPTAGLVKEVRVSPEDIRGLAEDGLGWTILAGLVHPTGLLSYLRDHGILADQLREAVQGAGAARGRCAGGSGGGAEVPAEDIRAREGGK